MRGFTQISNDALFDLRLSLGARVTYPVMRHLAWEAGRREEDDGVRLPALEVIAAKVGCSRTSLRAYMTELRRVGLVVGLGSGRGGMTYYVFDTEADTEAELSARKNRAESDRKKGRNLTVSRERVNEGEDNGNTQDPQSPPDLVNLDRLPEIVLVNRRNLPVDALCEVCGIVDRSPRVRQAVTAINGRGADTGIRGLFWSECRDVAETAERLADLAQLQADPERFAELLAQRIRRKARLIRECQPWRTTITPANVHDLWLDIEHTEPDAGLTPAQMASFPS